MKKEKKEKKVKKKVIIVYVSSDQIIYIVQENLKQYDLTNLFLTD